jgi:hypothetical protein
MAYLGSIVPEGWVFLDGVTQTNTNGKFTRVNALGIGTLSGNDYTPPNYKGAFLRGIGTCSTSISTGYVGPALGAYQHCMTQQHSHVTSSHSHTNGIGDGIYGLTVNGYETAILTDFDPDYKQPNLNYTYALKQTTGGTSVNIGDVTNATTNATETMPFNFGVNWIMKL